MAYYSRGQVYNNYDNVKSIENLLKAKSLNHGSQLPGILRYIGSVYLQSGFLEKSKYCAEEALKLDKDSLEYYENLAYDELASGNFEKSIELYMRCALDSSNTYIYWSLGIDYMFLDKYEEALKYFKEWLKRSKSLSDQYLFGMHRLGWAYWQKGNKREAEYYFNELIKYCDKVRKMGRVSVDPLRPAYDLAATYSILGDRKKAYENLKLWSRIPNCPMWWLTYLKNDPLFNKIKDEPEFQQIVKDVEAKYQAEHERVRKWLEDQGML
jgi:tetratricopeptide (TPR) repeat protein